MAYVTQRLCEWRSSFKSAADIMLEQYFKFMDNRDRFQDYNAHQIWAKDMLQDCKFVQAGPDVSPHADF